MKNSKFSTIPLLLVLLGLGLKLSAQQRPNIVFYIADDAGFLDNSVFGKGEVHTPTMEKLAKEGIRFNNAFVASPACAPSRAALLTGLMPARNGAEPNHSYPTPNIKVLTQFLQESGYEVIAFGKIAHDKMNNTVGFDFYSEPRVNLAVHVKEYFATHEVKKPICLLVGDHRPHVPWIKTPTYNPNKITLPSYFIDTKETRIERARYYTDVTGMDKEMGEILNIVEKQFKDNFIFAFSSDHGAQWPFAKWNLYDLGIRTPLLMTWKGHIKLGSQSDAMVSWIDIFPTFIDIAKAKKPDNIDGKPFTDVLLGKTDKFRDKIYTTHSGDGKFNVYPIRSLHDGQYHYVLNLHPEYMHTNHSDLLKKDGAGDYWTSWYEKAKLSSEAMAIVKKYHERPAQELYDIKEDPFEQYNLALDPKYRMRIAEMDTDLREWMKEQGDKETVYQTPILKTTDFNIEDN